ncbi:MAG: hypothetical protein KF833_22300 [Verrucomicrobiae bacterium]|nr:hypothetical protein [Verrucomicrobiae bacterium]
MKARIRIVVALLAGVSGGLLAGASTLGGGPVVRQGGEFLLTPQAPGDQVLPHLALGSTGGWLVWQDAATDGQGLGISALAVNETLSPQGGRFRINEIATGDQEHARVALLPGGGAVFVWQGAPREGFPSVYARILGPSGTFVTGDIRIPSGAGEHQVEPSVAVLTGGVVVITWASFRQDSANYDVFGRLISASGTLLGEEFRVNQQIGMGRRAPTVASSAEGGFLVAWVGERLVGERDFRDDSGRRVIGGGAPVFEIALYTRAFSSSAQPLTGDQRIAGTDAPAAHPTLVAIPGGPHLLAWTKRNPTSRENGYDIAALRLGATGQPLGSEFLVNQHVFGDQYRPRLAAGSSGALAVWSSMGQDGSWEGVYGRWVDGTSGPSADEFLVNSTTGGGQIFPAVAGDGRGRFLTAWSSNLPGSGMDLFGQRLVIEEKLAPPGVPLVSGLTSSSVMISWPPVPGIEVASYRVYAAGGGLLAEVDANYWVYEALAPGSVISVEIAYVLASGEASPRSAAAQGRTWGADRNFDGLPDDWQELYWPGAERYPGPHEDSDGDGATNLEEWLAGTDPTDPTSRLTVRVQPTPLGLRVEWTTRPGFLYQLQSSSDGRVWTAQGGPRFAADTVDGITLMASEEVSLYRVLRVR